MREATTHKDDAHAALRRVLSSGNQREKARAAQSILACLSSGKLPKERIPLDLMVRISWLPLQSQAGTHGDKTGATAIPILAKRRHNT